MIAIVQEKSKEIVNATAFAYASPGGANESSPGAEALGKLARTTHERRRWRHAREIAFASHATAKHTTAGSGRKVWVIEKMTYFYDLHRLTMRPCAFN